MYSTRSIHSPSPYPLSSPSSSDSEEEPLFESSMLRSAIASLPEARLRAILHKLADTNPRFQQAISREIAQMTLPISPITPTTPMPTPNKQRRKRRPSSARRATKQVQLPYATAAEPKPEVIHPHPHGEYQVSLYHPGHLEEEVYEFLSASPDQRHDPSFQVVQTITMWNCCEGDEWSPGCMSVPVFPSSIAYGPYTHDIIEFRHPDILPDSEVEQR